ncbi:MAG: hypothetical protein E5V80_10585 [Mesorhizobium sp.]|nr:MAG: hypothetical protein E5V80_10585 [Mesorhizobium sp.]
MGLVYDPTRRPITGLPKLLEYAGQELGFDRLGFNRDRLATVDHVSSLECSAALGNGNAAMYGEEGISTDPSEYLRIHLVDCRRLKRLYDELPDGDVGLEMIADELERRGEEGWC